MLCIDHISFTYLSTDGHLVCLSVVATMNNAVGNTGTQVSLRDLD